MLHLVLCFSVWTLIFATLFWRLVAIAQLAIKHLQRLHQIPCNKCAYFTGDYRLKCTVNPMTAMSETAIGCRDFLYDERRDRCGRCKVAKQCSSAAPTLKRSLFKLKPPFFAKVRGTGN